MSSLRRSRLESYTAHHHLRAAIGQGVVSGVFLLNEYVARKGLAASRWQILALLLVPALFQFVAVVWNPATRRGRLGRRPFVLLGFPGRLLLLLPLLIPQLRTASNFTIVLAAAMAFEVLLIPAQNALVASNYPAATRGRWFGLVTAVQALTIVVVSVPSGLLLDRFPGAWPLLHGVAALAGLWGYRHWARLRPRRVRRALPSDLPEHSSPIAALRKDRTFLAFEVCFMVYGTGFLMLQPVLPLYLVDELHVSYSQVGVARGLIFWLAMVVAGPLFGRLSDRFGILRTCSAAYLLLAGFPLALLLFPGILGLNFAFGLYGFAMAGVHVAWNLGPIVLARGRDPVPYLNAHVALVGIRALIGMVGGSWMQAAWGSRSVFACAAGLEILAAAGMLWTARASGRRWTLRAATS